MVNGTINTFNIKFCYLCLFLEIVLLFLEGLFVLPTYISKYRFIKVRDTMEEVNVNGFVMKTL